MGNLEKIAARLGEKYHRFADQRCQGIPDPQANSMSHTQMVQSSQTLSLLHSCQRLILSLVKSRTPHVIAAFGCFLTVVLFASTPACATDSQDGLKDTVVLIIRHAEKPDAGPGLSPSGQQRAEAYKDYFQNFAVDSKAMRPDAIFAAKDSKASQRPRLTVEPFAQ